MAAPRRFGVTVFDFKSSTIRELLEGLSVRGVTSLHGLRLVGEAHTSMDGCNEKNIIFDKKCLVISDTLSSDDVKDVFDPTAFPEELNCIAVYLFSEFGMRAEFYTCLHETILEEGPIAMVVVRDGIPEAPEDIKHLLTLDGYEKDLPIVE